jgi:hypothetical protein
VAPIPVFPSSLRQKTFGGFKNMVRIKPATATSPTMMIDA